MQGCEVGRPYCGEAGSEKKRTRPEVGGPGSFLSLVRWTNYIAVVFVHDIRAFSADPHRKVDDEAYGGGPGMVMTAPVVAAAIESIRDAPGTERGKTVLLTPAGRRLDHSLVGEIGSLHRAILVCGRYEGIDHRVSEALDCRKACVAG